MALAAFVVRVVAQAAVRVTGWQVLPPFDAWHSGALPYSWLLASQLLVVAWMARTAWRVGTGTDRPLAAVPGGAFGTFLPTRDVCDPPLMFGAGGRLRVADHPRLLAPGFGIAGRPTAAITSPTARN